jgi:hypothetical protein
MSSDETVEALAEGWDLDSSGTMGDVFCRPPQPDATATIKPTCSSVRRGVPIRSPSWSAFQFTTGPQAKWPS